MILAAGVGSRLGGITETLPKALVDVGGVRMLERVARRLIDAGADRLIINISHHADQIVDFVTERDGFGVDVAFSREEPAPLETGGGVLHAASLFRRDAPFFLHNVDIITDFDLTAMYRRHQQSGALVTLACNQRETSRFLLFDIDAGLCGRYDKRAGRGAELYTDCESFRPWAFAGVHVISPPFLDLITETGKFSIVDTYMRLTGLGCRIELFDIGRKLWLEMGTPERLAAARAWAEQIAGSLDA